MEVTIVKSAEDVNKAYVDRSVGINGTIVDQSKYAGDRINCIIDDDFICIVV